MSFDFTGKRALVTGAGRGIGKEVARQLVKSGAEVFALSKTKANLDALRNELPTIKTLCVDLEDWKATRRAVEEIGVIDLLVNNAGILEVATFEEITEEAFDKTFAVNVKPMINISQVVVKKLKEKGKPGSIVNVASISIWVNYTGEAIYGLSKAAVGRLTRLMAKELGPYGIRVNSVNPTWVETEMAKLVMKPEDEADMIKNIPLGRICSVEDVADNILFLLSDRAKMVNGISLPVDGGELAH